MPTMTPRQRFLTALRCQQPDRVPIFDWLNNPALYEAFLGQHPGHYNGYLAAAISWRPIIPFMREFHWRMYGHL